MDIQQNTEFVLGKIDSLMQTALPHLQQGAEEVIKYKVILFQAEFLAELVFLGICLGLAFKYCIKLHKINTDDGCMNDGMVLGEVFLWIATCTFSIVYAFAVTCNIPKFVASIVSPEIFAIMQLIGN